MDLQGLSTLSQNKHSFPKNLVRIPLPSLMATSPPTPHQACSNPWLHEPKCFVLTVTGPVVTLSTSLPDGSRCSIRWGGRGPAQDLNWETRAVEVWRGHRIHGSVFVQRNVELWGGSSGSTTCKSCNSNNKCKRRLQNTPDTNHPTSIQAN